jgi:hypothetical protein
MYVVHSDYTWCELAYLQIYKRKTTFQNNQSGETKKGVRKREKSLPDGFNNKV